MSLQMIGFGFSPMMQQPCQGGAGFNPMTMLMQGLQMMGGGFSGQGGPGACGCGGGQGAFGPMGGANPFGAYGNPGAALGGCFGQGGSNSAYQAGFQAGMQAASGGGAMSPYQAGFQQGMASASGGFGGPGMGPGCGSGNPLMEILNLLMRMMGGGMGGPGMGGPGGGMPGFGCGGGDPFGGGNFGPPGGFSPQPHHPQHPHHGGGHHPGGGEYHPGPPSQHNIHDGGVREVYDRGQMNHGKLQYTAGMQIDCDGSGSSHGDPCYQSQTSMHMANGQSLNADRTPYIVLPPQMAKKYGVHLGDMALVRHGDKVSPAIFGDVGPRNKLGEGSVRLAENLGINSSPTRGGTSSGVEYTVFPGSGRGVKWTPENTTTEALWERIRAQQGGGR